MEKTLNYNGDHALNFNSYETPLVSSFVDPTSSLDITTTEAEVTALNLALGALGSELQNFTFGVNLIDTTVLALSEQSNSTSYSFSDYNTTGNSTELVTSGSSLTEAILISLVVAILAVVTIIGNLLVIIAFKIEKQLQTISNYFLLSLAVADLTIGLVSMPLFTMYLVIGHWPLGSLFCDIWLSIDYTMSNASAAGLLLISFDRYLSVTRPLTYRAKRTSRKVIMMICTSWVISVLLWTPWIFAWPYLEGKRTVPEKECYIQFLHSNAYVTIGTHLIAFYIPVTIMTILYYKIYKETRKRQKRMPMLQGTNKETKKRIPSDTNQYPGPRKFEANTTIDEDDMYEIADNYSEVGNKSIWSRCVCCNIDRDYDVDESSTSDPASPNAQRNSLTDLTKNGHDAARKRQLYKMNSRSMKSKRQSNNSSLVIPLMAMEAARVTPMLSNRPQPIQHMYSTCDSLDSPSSPILDTCLLKEDEMYSIVIQLPRNDSADSISLPTIRMQAEPDMLKSTCSILNTSFQDQDSSGRISGSDSSDSLSNEDTPLNQKTKFSYPDVCERPREKIPPPKGTPALGRRIKSNNAQRTAQNARLAAKVALKVKQQRARKKRSEKKQEKKAAKTLSAILLAFIITWTPYNIFTLAEIFCSGCVPPILYNFGK